MGVNYNFFSKDIIYDKSITQDIEDYIIKNYIYEKEIYEYKYILEHNFTNETYLSLSPKRENIISWYPITKNDDILEIGSRLRRNNRFVM